MKGLAILTIALLMVSALPLVLADEAGSEGGITIEVEEPENFCPVIYQDPTQRGWFPNDQTIYTATEYGSCGSNIYGDVVCEVEDRGNYVFQGETLTFYIVVEDPNGADDIQSVVIDDMGACLAINTPTSVPQPYASWGSYAEAKFGIEEWDAETMALYKCKVIVGPQTGDLPIVIETEDLDLLHGGYCMDKNDDEQSEISDDKETILFNPTLTVALSDPIAFGSVRADSTATSNSIQIQNIGTEGVVLDMYIASDDYFTAVGDEDAICGDGNGIKYDRFAYYATKGSVNSGKNNNDFPGLGETSGICDAEADEFTPMPSHSGEIGDMCRIINHLPKGSFLTQGDEMSLTLQLHVPANCEPASYTNGEFHIVGRVV